MTDSLHIPNSPSAERAVLGACLVSEEALSEVSGYLRPEHFYSDLHSAVFRSILETSAQARPVDLVTLAPSLSAQGINLGDVTSLVDALPDASAAMHYAEIVLENHKKRSLLTTSMKMQGDSVSPAVTSEECIDRVAKSLSDLSDVTSRDETVHISTVVNTQVQTAVAIRHGERTSSGLESGFYDLDKTTGGFRPGELTLIAARPRIGKSALLLNIVRNMGKNGVKSLVFSIEMSDSSLVQRVLSSEARINTRAFLVDGFLSGEAESRLICAGDIVGDLPIWLNDVSRMTPRKMRSVTRTHATKHGVDCVVVDYAQLVKPDVFNHGESRATQLSEIVKDIRAIGKDLNVPVLCACQLRRSGAGKTEETRPTLEDLKESGGLEEHSDVVILMHRNSKESLTHVEVAKNRFGPEGRFVLTFKSEYTLFENAGQ